MVVHGAESPFDNPALALVSVRMPLVFGFGFSSR